ncbi:MAG TPA: polyprenyl synthetase family protein [Pyrinomonadaceae bacterium]|jgi:octaprenyl-diphosphate synthase|nr:polyprenyl synthetase family protein [Pyrinomonadaceae bacterium]
MTLSSHTLTLDEEAKISARRIFSLIANELQQVEIEFERQARSNVQVIAYLADYLRKSGGKRVRPALTILSNYAVGGEGNRYNSIRMATVMEFLHTATLVHDDIIDKADTRRNRPTVNALYGNETAVLMGDWLYMSAFETSLAERSLPILDILTSVTRKMTEGELLQLTLLGHADVSEAQYLDVLKRKTAYLFSASCEIGAILGGATEAQRTALREYGLNLGTAFQLIDDLLDFTSTEAALGKAAGADLLGGKVTLPLIYLRESEPSTLKLIQQVLSERSYQTVSQQLLLDALAQTNALERARAIADEYAENARTALECLPDSAYCDSLRSLPTYVLNRDR